MSYTNAQLRNRVAEDLGVKATDQELSDEIAAKIEDRIDTVTAMYREQGLFWWADDAIPDAVVEGLTLVMCAWACASVRKAGQGHEEKLMPGLALIAAAKSSGTTDTLRTLYY
jgi:hypothetical protein